MTLLDVLLRHIAPAALCFALGYALVRVLCWVWEGE